MEIQVLEVLDGEPAVVSTKGLVRVLMANTGESLDELLTPEEADWSARGWNNGGEPLTEPVRYSA